MYQSPNMLFTEKDFDKFRNFQKRAEREFGENAYVGTDNVCVVVEYSPELKAMLRPVPSAKHYEFSLDILSCRDCKTKRVFLCLPEQIEYLCENCLGKRKKTEKPPEVKKE